MTYKITQGLSELPILRTKYNTFRSEEKVITEESICLNCGCVKGLHSWNPTDSRIDCPTRLTIEDYIREKEFHQNTK